MKEIHDFLAYMQVHDQCLFDRHVEISGIRVSAYRVTQNQINIRARIRYKDLYEIAFIAPDEIRITVIVAPVYQETLVIPFTDIPQAHISSIIAALPNFVSS